MIKTLRLPKTLLKTMLLIAFILTYRGSKPSFYYSSILLFFIYTYVSFNTTFCDIRI